MSSLHGTRRWRKFPSTRDSGDPDAVRVELYAAGVNGGDPVRKEMTRGPKLVGAENGYVYGAQVQATRPATDYTARVIPHHTGIAVPLEAAHILWQR